MVVASVGVRIGLDPLICEVGGAAKGLLLPALGDTEAGWPNWLKCVLYLLGLLWCFMGVAIIADVFMGAIEQVTSKKKRVISRITGKETTVKVWNATVANLTLMALGSSAPEILLNVKEIFENNFFSGKLGPMTIVGSAAFNLMVIIAVCVSAIPSGETRKIKDLSVYSITACFSIFAYLWLLFILIGPTPDSVDVAEGLCTFFFFPVLVFLSYLADIGRLPGQTVKVKTTVHPEASKEEMEKMAKKVKDMYGDDLTESQIAALIHYELSQGNSRAFHRVNATRQLFAGKSVKAPYLQGKVIADQAKGKGARGQCPVVGFAETDWVVFESKGTVQVKVLRTGKLDQEIKVHYKTVDGEAKEGSDYEKTEGDLLFKSGQAEKRIDIKILSAEQGHEEAERFFVELSEAGEEIPVWGPTKCRVHIVDEKQTGKFAFEQEQLEVTRPTETKEELEITVVRKRGWDGKVSMEYCTESESATAGADYEEVEGTLTFEPRQKTATIKVTVLPKEVNNSDGREVFRLLLKDSTGKAKFDPNTDGGEESCILTVFLGMASDEDKLTHNISSVMRNFKVNHDQMKLGHAMWSKQFSSAIYCCGDREAMAEAGIMDWIVHIIALPWKLFFALVPPTEFAGGWACFVIALAAIGFVTILIGDLAGLLGCAFGISPFATAITFVALGTSLPDTFASKTAAVQDDVADASIGNVTGSNSVNVFLGLGLPWAVGSIYWSLQEAVPGSEWYNRYGKEANIVARYPKGAFIVKSDGMGLSVGVFSACSIACLATLAVRRKVIGAELGGPNLSKWATSAFFVILWVVYIAISIMNAPKD